MRKLEIRVAEKFGILERCKAFEQDLLQIKDVIPDESEDGISFDLNGLLSGISHVIIVPKYNIPANREDYWEARESLRKGVIEVAEKHDLHRTGDRIEDYGEHFYFVFQCGPSWIPKEN